LLQDFQTALNAFGETMAATMSHCTAAQGSYLAAGFRQVQWLFATFGCYAQRALSKTDVAVMFISRKILVDQVGLAAIGSSLPAYYRHPQQQIGAQNWPVMYANGQLGHLQEPRSVRAILGALLFLAAVESGWQMHHKAVQYLPRNVQAAMSPMQVSILLYCLHIEYKDFVCLQTSLGCSVAASSAQSLVHKSSFSLQAYSK